MMSAEGHIRSISTKEKFNPTCGFGKEDFEI
jgi:hypothetical protein